jgi:hypothetical protein
MNAANEDVGHGPLPRQFREFILDRFAVRHLRRSPGDSVIVFPRTWRQLTKQGGKQNANTTTMAHARVRSFHPRPRSTQNETGLDGIDIERHAYCSPQVDSGNIRARHLVKLIGMEVNLHLQKTTSCALELEP